MSSNLTASSADTLPMIILPELTKLVLLRHGESEGNASKIIQGSGEYPLSENGKRQAMEARDTVSKWNLKQYVSSDLSRAFDTAVILSGSVKDIVLDERFRERGAGKWEGVSREELERAYPGSIENDDLRPDDYESEESVLNRIIPAMEATLLFEGLSRLRFKCI